MPAPQAFEVEATRRAEQFSVGKTYRVALTNAAPDLASDEVLADITEIDYTGLSSRDLTLDALPARDGATQAVIAQDLTLSASGADVGPFRYAVIHLVDGAGNDLKFVFDYGVEYTIIDASDFVIDFTGNFAVFGA